MHEVVASLLDLESLLESKLVLQVVAAAAAAAAAESGAVAVAVAEPWQR